MRHVTILAASVAIVAAAVWDANASPVWIDINNWSSGGGAWAAGSSFLNPAATSGGALWIQKTTSGHNTGAAPVLLDEDVNFQIMCNEAPLGTNGTGGWTSLGIALLSVPIPEGQYSAQGSAIGDVTSGDDPPHYGGYFLVNGIGRSAAGAYFPGQYTFPGSYVNLPGKLDFEIFAWTGNYSTYADAKAAGEYVGDSGIFSNYVNTPSGLSQMPAVILAKPSAGLPGDANLDGKVDFNDLSRVLTNYDKTGMLWAQGDFTADGIVNFNDLSKVLTNYDKTAASASSLSSVPEPGTLALLAAGLVGLLAYAWRKSR